MDAATEASATFRLDENDRPAVLIWSQSGVSSTYRKQSVPSRLNLRADAGRILLTVTGDTGIDYVVEGSEDLERWVPIATTTIWDDPVAVLPESGTAHRFYRAWKPE